jgi:hypothetical protein
VTSAVVAASATALMMSSRVRVREMILWILVAVSVLNFAPVLYEPTHLLDQPTWMKVIKDIPVGFAIAVLLGLITRSAPTEVRRLVRAFAWALSAWALYIVVNAVIWGSPLTGFSARCKACWQ